MGSIESGAYIGLPYCDEAVAQPAAHHRQARGGREEGQGCKSSGSLYAPGAQRRV